MSADPEVLRGLADEIERLFGEGRRDASAMIGSLVYSNIPVFLAALRASQDGAAAMQTELRPFKDGEGEGLDEVVIYGSHIIHAETMSDTALWIGIHDEAGGLVHIWVNAVRRKGRLGIVMTATDEGDRGTIVPKIPLAQPDRIPVPATGGER